RDRGIGAAKEDIFACGFEVVVNDVKGTGTVPAADGLRVVTLAVNLVDVGVADGDLAAVETHPALHLLRRKAMNPTPIDHEVVRHVGSRLRCFTKANQIVGLRAGCRGNLYADKTIVMRAGSRPDHLTG